MPAMPGCNTATSGALGDPGPLPKEGSPVQQHGNFLFASTRPGPLWLRNLSVDQTSIDYTGKVAAITNASARYHAKVDALVPGRSEMLVLS